MPTTAETVAAQRWFADQPGYFQSKAVGGTSGLTQAEKLAKYRENKQLRLDYVAALTEAEKKIFYDDNKKYAAEMEDAIDRARKTASRKHLQAFTKTAAVFVAAGMAAPLAFGPATGGLYAAGSTTGGVAVGTGVATGASSTDIAAQSMENQAWTDSASVAMVSQVVAPPASPSLLSSIGSTVGAIVKPVADVAVSIAGAGKTTLDFVSDVMPLFTSIKSSIDSLTGIAADESISPEMGSAGSQQPAQTLIFPPAAAVADTGISKLVLFAIVGVGVILIVSRFKK